MARKKASEVVAAVEQAAETAIKKSRPAAQKAGKAATEVASFVFETTRAAVRKLPGRVFGPPCPRCGARTVVRRNRTTGHYFCACSAWHDTGCAFTANVVFSDND